MMTGGALSSSSAVFSLLLHPSATFLRRFGGCAEVPTIASKLVLSSCSPEVIPFVVKSGRSSFAESSKLGAFVEGSWEEPDDGDFSEDEDFVDREDEGYDKQRSGNEREFRPLAYGVDRFVMPQYEELLKEVEMLLEPEEKIILQNHELPDLSKISTLKWNPFHTMALADQIPFADKLLELGTDIDCLDKDGLTALHKAIIGKKEAVISHLLRKGANPHLTDRDGATSLHYAIQVGAIQTVKLLIKYKVDVNLADNDGWTPLHVAVQCRSRDIAKILLVNGADKTRRNKEGKTALDLCLCYGKDFKSYDLAKLLKLVPANRDP